MLVASKRISLNSTTFNSYKIPSHRATRMSPKTMAKKTTKLQTMTKRKKTNLATKERSRKLKTLLMTRTMTFPPSRSLPLSLSLQTHSNRPLLHMPVQHPLRVLVARGTPRRPVKAILLRSVLFADGDHLSFA